MAERQLLTRHGLRLLNGAARLEKDWWRWWAWLEGPDEALDAVESVRYALHPTFPEPVRTITDRESKFRLEAIGWGEFNLGASVTMKDGASFSLERWITFGGTEEGSSAAEPGRRPRVFASFSAIDRRFVHPLIERLEQHGIEVTTADRIPAEAPFVRGIGDAMQQADLLAVVTHGELGAWAEEEVDYCRQRNKPVVPVLIRGASVPPPLAGFAALRLESDADLDAVSDAIAARAKDAFYADETG